jgi:beta-lactamase class A
MRARFAILALAAALQLEAADWPPAVAAELQVVVDRAARETLAEFTQPPLRPEQLACTVVDLRVPVQPRLAHYRGDERFYPASVIKLFFLVYAHRLLEDGRLADTPELQRGLRDMIVESYNEATGFVIDSITGTTSGPELSPDELAVWSEKRGVVTRYFDVLGYRNVSARRKTWGEGPYGREKQDMAAHLPARNFLSTNDTARLLTDITLGRCVTPARSAEMLALMARDPAKAPAGDEDFEGVGFTGPALALGMKLWSKAGWVSWARHDAALIELPGGGRVIIVTFTGGEEHAKNRRIIAALAHRILTTLPAPP